MIAKFAWVVVALVWVLGFGTEIARAMGAPIVYVREPEPPQEVLVRAESQEEYIIRRIRETFPEDPERALAIARCESGLRPDVTSHTSDGGIFQINLPVHGWRLQQLALDPYDIEDNLTYARMLYDEREWHPWVCNRKI